MEQLQSHIWLMASSYMEEYLRISHILGRPSSYMTLQLLHSEFPYIWGKFDFLFSSVYQCKFVYISDLQFSWMLSFNVTLILPFELNMLSYCHTMQYGYLSASFLFQFTFSSISRRQNNNCEHNVLPKILSSGRADGTVVWCDSIRLGISEKKLILYCRHCMSGTPARIRKSKTTSPFL